MSKSKRLKEFKKLVAKGYNRDSIIEILDISRRTYYYYLEEIGDIPEVGDRILILDIETAPMLSYHWGLWKQNIGKSMRIEGDRTYMMCWSAKWLGEEGVFYAETRNEDDSFITQQLLDLLDEADVVVTHNGDKFDLKKINTFAIINDLPPPSPYRSIDTLKYARKKFSFERNNLDYLADILGCSPKGDHGKFHGFDLWNECIKGNDEAWEEMKKYNIQDIITLEEVYLKLRSWVKGVHLSVGKDLKCPTCSSDDIVRDGLAYTNASVFKRYRCNRCNSWHRARYSEKSNVATDRRLTQC